MTAPRHAWVLSGRYAPAPGPLPEFEGFLTRHGGELFSLSSLDQARGWLARTLRRHAGPRLALAALVLRQARRFDAIIASGEDIGIPLALASVARGSRVPIHMMFHGHHLDSAKLRALAPLLRRLPHVHLHCLSAALRARTMAVLGIPASRCHATGHGVDTAWFTPAPFAPDGPIASAGAAKRDYATLAEAVRGLPVALRIAADSTWVGVAAAEAPADPPANVEIASCGDMAGLRDLYGRARFVVVPLHPAGHASGYAVIAEAMAMGRAVVATRTEVPPDFLIPGVTGLFVNPHDVAGLRGTIRRLLETPREAETLGRAAGAEIAAKHSLEAFGDRLARVVADSIAARSA